VVLKYLAVSSLLPGGLCSAGQPVNMAISICRIFLFCFCPKVYVVIVMNGGICFQLVLSIDKI